MAAEKKYTQKQLDEAVAKAVAEERESLQNEFSQLIADEREGLQEAIKEAVVTALKEQQEHFTATLETLEPVEGGMERIPLSEADAELICDACDAYGISDDFILDANIDRTTGEAVVVTKGGAKVRYAPDMEIVPLTEIQVTGINRAPERKPITGGTKKQAKK